MAARGQGETDVLLGRAQRVRRRLHEGCPEGWVSERSQSHRFSQYLVQRLTAYVDCFQPCAVAD
jgi:hypothetical protein